MTDTPISSDAMSVTVSFNIEDLLHRTWVRDDPDEASTVSSTIIGLAAHDLANRLRDDVRAEITEVVREQVADIIRDTIAEGVMLTNQWGEATGEQTSLRDHIMEMTRKQLDQKVTEKGGKPDVFDRRGTSMSWMRYTVKSLVEQELRETMQQVTTEITNQAKAAIRASVTENLTETILRNVKRSL